MPILNFPKESQETESVIFNIKGLMNSSNCIMIAGKVLYFVITVWSMKQK